MDVLVAFLLFVIFVPKAVPVKYSNVLVRASLFALAITIVSSTTCVNRENVQSVTQQCLKSCASKSQTKSVAASPPPPPPPPPEVVAAPPPPPPDCTLHTCPRFIYNDRQGLPEQCFNSQWYGIEHIKRKDYVFDCVTQTKFRVHANGNWCPMKLNKQSDGSCL